MRPSKKFSYLVIMNHNHKLSICKRNSLIINKSYWTNQLANLAKTQIFILHAKLIDLKSKFFWFLLRCSLILKLRWNSSFEHIPCFQLSVRKHQSFSATCFFFFNRVESIKEVYVESYLFFLRRFIDLLFQKLTSYRWITKSMLVILEINKKKQWYAFLFLISPRPAN